MIPQLLQPQSLLFQPHTHIIAKLHDGLPWVRLECIWIPPVSTDGAGICAVKAHMDMNAAAVGCRASFLRDWKVRSKDGKNNLKIT